MIISKLEILKMGRGHSHKFCGTGIHRNKKRSPKGNRSQLNRKFIQEY